MSFGGRGYTKLDEEWRSAVTTLGCLCCIDQGYPHDVDGPRVEQHHQNGRACEHANLMSVGMCMWHHRGRLIVTGWSHADHRERLGPSLQEGSVPFHRYFGSDEELQQRQRRLLVQNGMSGLLARVMVELGEVDLG